MTAPEINSPRARAIHVLHIFPDIGPPYTKDETSPIIGKAIRSAFRNAKSPAQATKRRELHRWSVAPFPEVFAYFTAIDSGLPYVTVSPGFLNKT
jgi:hypothetical protein